MKKQTTPEMRRSWLVQRLELPASAAFLGLRDNPFSFGGGKVNGGISPKAMDLIRPLFSFDYMGAAEYEFGAVPEALNKMVNHAESKNGVTADAITIPLTEVAKHWRDDTKKPPVGDATVYLLCAADHREEVERRVRAWAKQETGRGSDSPDAIRDITFLASVLRPAPEDEYPRTTCGWLELDNGFFFFTNEQMWRGVSDLFGADLSVEASA